MSLTVKNLTVTYPGETRPAVQDLSFCAEAGTLTLITGASGSGKTTLLRTLKPVLSPAVRLQGEALLDGTSVFAFDNRRQAAEIGFVFQSPDDQIVTDRVWQELAFGLENLGFAPSEIRRRVAEMSSFFGLDDLYDRPTDTLSGGEKQLVNLASVMVMDPKLLLLDEPAAMLDPVSAERFFHILDRIHRELPTTILLCEHRLEELYDRADRVLVLRDGKCAAQGNPRETARILLDNAYPESRQLPLPARAFHAFRGAGEIPLRIGGCREFLKEKADKLKYPPLSKRKERRETAVEVKDCSFRYRGSDRDTLQDLSLRVSEGEILAVVGGNGSRKSTLLSLLKGQNSPYTGSVKLFGKSVKNISVRERFGTVIGSVPQDPTVLLTKDTVAEELDGLPEKEWGLDHLLNRHPFDISGGEQQMLACCKVLRRGVKILLLDEPTKGMDHEKKEILARFLHRETEKGVCIIMVSHDLSFCARHADRCALLFDGSVASAEDTRRFFSSNTFYTTPAVRLVRGFADGIVTDEDLLRCAGQEETK